MSWLDFAVNELSIEGLALKRDPKNRKWLCLVSRDNGTKLEGWGKSPTDAILSIISQIRKAA